LSCVDDFLVDNYLSDDERYPLSELGTNAPGPPEPTRWRPYVGTEFQLEYKQMKKEQVKLQDYDKDSTQSTCTIR